MAPDDADPKLPTNKSDEPVDQGQAQGKDVPEKKAADPEKPEKKIADSEKPEKKSTDPEKHDKNHLEKPRMKRSSTSASTGGRRRSKTSKSDDSRRESLAPSDALPNGGANTERRGSKASDRRPSRAEHRESRAERRESRAERRGSRASGHRRGSRSKRGSKDGGIPQRSRTTSIDPQKKPLDDEKKPPSEKKKKKPFFYGLSTLYAFADTTDIHLMILGTALALIQSGLPPFVWLIMGDFVTFAIRREEIKLNLTDEPRHEIYRVANSSMEIDQSFNQSATPVVASMLALSFATFFAAFFQRLVWEFSGIRQVFRVRKAYICKLLSMDVAWLECKHSGQVASMLHDHADTIYQGIADHLPMVIFISSYLAVCLSVCFYIQWEVTLVMFSSLPILIGTRMIFSKWFCKTLDDEMALHNKMTNLVLETFQSIRTVIAFSAQRHTIYKFDKIASEHNRMTEERLRASSVYDALAQIFLTEFIFTLALCYGMWRVGSENPGQLVALAINMLYMCVTSISIGFHVNGVSTATQNAEEMFGMLNEAPTIENDRLQRTAFAPKRGYSVKPVEDGLSRVMEEIKKPIPKGHGGITFKDVNFSYPSRPDVRVLKGLNLDIKPGEHIAVVGSSGSGKSTLTALLLRFYDPCSGTIMMDGIDIRLMNPNDVRSEVGLVSQEPVLFDGTISDNIRYGRLEATQGEINDAARRAEAWQFISTLPDCMQTRVGERGLQLSGGQKQRVAIARAVIRNPSIMIFDEATSALDTKHEHEVQKAIDAASQDVTTITIAHRLSTIRNSDRIIVLENGRVVENGPPDALIAKPDSIFHKMWEDQQVDKEEANADVSSLKEEPAPAEDPKFRYKHSMTVAQLLHKHDKPDFTGHRVTWERSSLGSSKKTAGKSYKVSTEGEKLALPVMSKKRPKSFKTNVMEAPLPHVETKASFDEEAEMAGRPTNLRALFRLIGNFKSGYTYLFASLPVTVLRGVLFLLVCFEVASVLEIAMAPTNQVAQQVLIVAAVYSSLIIIKTIFEAVGRLAVALYGHSFCIYLRGQMFRQLLRHGAAYFDEEENTPGRIVHKVITDTASLNRILGDKLDLLLPALVCSIVSVSIALFINWELALICSFQFPAFFTFRYIELRETGKRQKNMVEEEKKAANLATMVLSNMPTIKAYTLQSHFAEVFYSALRPLQSNMKRQACISAFVFACQFSFSYILIAITLYFGKNMMLANEITPFDYIRVVLLTQFGANFISQLIASVSDFARARVAAENVLEVITEPAVDMDNLSNEGLCPKLEGSVTLRNVSFRYPSRPIVPILKNLNIKVAPGHSVAIVGPSGCGKSSVLAMCQRMYTPTSGEVLIDHYNVRSINPNYLHRVMVSVSQEPSLFSFTIKQNIAYGLSEDEYTMDKVIKAAKTAQIHDFIKTLPKGYDTEVGEFGAQLSGGQRQRIAIARAIIRDPKILLMDEATAALDARSEKAVKKALETVGKKCTCIFVAHRLSSIRNVDRIIVIVDGEIAETGTHHELMELKGIYYDMNQQ